MTIKVPDHFAGYHERFSGEAGKRWIARLPTLVDTYMRRWELSPAGKVTHGMVSLIVPVVMRDESPAVLKLRPIDSGEAIALRVWHGEGAVRLLDAEHTDATSIMLLERLRGDRTLAMQPIDHAVEVIGNLLARLTVHIAPAEIPRVDVPEIVAAQHNPAHARLLRSWIDAAQELRGQAGDRLLHGDLHYLNVLAADREPWLAIDPQPLAGHPGFELLPALRNRWPETGDVHRAIRRRFDQLTEILEVDRSVALAWTCQRIACSEVGYARRGATGLDPKHVTIVEALAGMA